MIKLFLTRELLPRRLASHPHGRSNGSQRRSKFSRYLGEVVTRFVSEQSPVIRAPMTSRDFEAVFRQLLRDCVADALEPTDAGHKREDGPITCPAQLRLRQ
jgi:FMN-dependent NADH-azoreductase